jgi:hypothetical protein
MIRERYSGLSSRQMEEIDGTKIRICMANIMRFIDSLEIEKVPLDMDYSKREYKNIFMDMHNCTKYSSMTETRFDSRIHPLYGNFDLIIGSRIIDYKTGKSSTIEDVQKRMTLSNRPKYFEFQPLVYLSLLKEHLPPPHRFSLFYAADNDVRSVTDEGFDIRNNIREVVLVGMSMKEYLSDPDSPAMSEYGESYGKLLDNWSAFVNRAYEAGVQNHAYWKNDTVLISSLLSIFGMNENPSNTKKVATALNKLARIISAGMFVENGADLAVPSDTMERFLSRVDEDQVCASKQYFSVFPQEPKIDCGDCDFFKVCTWNIVNLEGGDEDE